MKVKLHRKIYDCVAKDAFNFIAPIDLTTIFTGNFLFPAVVDINSQPDSWDKIGQIRYPVFSDGSHATEQLIDYSAEDNRFGYKINGFSNYYRFLISEIRGEWQFSQNSKDTEVIWTYNFRARWYSTILVWIVTRLWRIYMERVLEKAIKLTKGTQNCGIK